jgi:tetratricopeptide (TPR) repeat protein
MTANGSTLSRFTPSLMSHELLERLFVARERTLDAVMARIDAAASTSERNHTLLVGPRGAGKTHLVSLVYHRVQERRDAGARLQVAWLPEDPWTLVSYRHLLAAIAGRLDPAVVGEIPRSMGELEALLASRAKADGPIVVIVENLDQILTAIKDEGQQRLRHLLQADRSLLLVSTSTQLDRTLSDQSSPFYGFFTTTRLEPFDVDEAAAMLAAIAEERGDDKLVKYLQSDAGRARLRTISHLAGGQPRMWAALASALTVNRLDGLIDLLLTRFDDLTPYYQEQLGRLSGQQRLVVAELAEIDRPINVSELAERLEIDQRSLGKTMSELVDRGWAAPTTSPITALLDQRRTYYELAEPLARLSFQIKESRGEPLRLVVEFLKHWFDPSDLGSLVAEGDIAEYLMLATDGQDHDPVVAVTRRLQRLPITRAPAVALLGEIDDALSALMTKDPEPFLRLPMPIRAALEQQLETHDTAMARFEVHQAAQGEFGHTRHPAMEPWIARAEQLMAMCDGSRTSAMQLLLAGWLGRAWRFDEATEVLSAAVAERETDDRLSLYARHHLAYSYSEAGRGQQAIELGKVVIEVNQRLDGPDHPATLSARSNLVTSYLEAGRTDDALELAQAVLDDTRRVLGPDDPATLIARSNLASAYRQAGRTEEGTELAEEVADDRRRVFGPNDPFTLAARSNLAVAYRDVGRTDEAIDLVQAVLADSERILGPDHPTTLNARSNLTALFWQTGRVEDAVAPTQTLLANFERILGPQHPSTRIARSNLAVALRAAGRTSDAERLESN